MYVIYFCCTSYIFVALQRLGIFLKTSEADNDGLFQIDDQFLAPVRQNSGRHVTLVPRLNVSAGCLQRVTAPTLHTVALSSGVND